MNKALECARKLNDKCIECDGNTFVEFDADKATAIIQQAITEAKREGFMVGVEAARLKLKGHVLHPTDVEFGDYEKGYNDACKELTEKVARIAPH